MERRLQYAIALLVTAWYTLLGPGLFVRLVSLLCFACTLIGALLHEARVANEESEREDDHNI